MKTAGSRFTGSILTAGTWSISPTVLPMTSPPIGDRRSTRENSVSLGSGLICPPNESNRGAFADCIGWTGKAFTTPIFRDCRHRIAMENRTTPQAQMIEIDSLLHAIHGRGAMAAVFIDGSRQTATDLLDELAGYDPATAT